MRFAAPFTASSWLSRMRWQMGVPVALLALCSPASPPPTIVGPLTEIAPGILYQCRRLATDLEGGGLVHLVQVDLSWPGIELYVTEVDAEAVQAGASYRLQHAVDAIEQQNLDVVINGTLFKSSSWLWPCAGDLATSLNTLVADHRVSGLNSDSYLLGFSDALVPYLETEKPPSPSALARARWGVSGQAVALSGGRISHFLNHVPDRRTAIGIDPIRQWLLLAVFERASERRVAEVLAGEGASDGLLLDGGHSTTMAIAGEQGAHQILLGGMWPVATFFGVRAGHR